MRRLARVLRGLAVLAAIVGGVPWALVRFVGDPLPTTTPDLSAALSSVERTGVDPTTVVHLLAIVVWIAWCRLVLALVVELVARSGRRPAPRVPGLGSSQRWAASLLASASLMGAGTGVLARAAGAVEVRGPVPAVAMAWSGGGLLSDGSDVGATSDERAPVSDPTTGRPSATPGAWSVARNDSWWRIAERGLGDGLRWSEVRDLNLGREVAPGVVFTAPDQSLQPGWVVALPGEGPAVAGPAGGASGSTVTVTPGDSLSRIADDQLGDPDAWTDLWELNEGRVVGSGERLTDPDLLRPGWVLVLPTTLPGPGSPGPGSPGPAPTLVLTESVARPLVNRATPEPAVAAAPAAPVDPTALTCVPSVAASPTGSVDAPPIAPVDVDQVADEDGASAPLSLAAATLLASAGLGVVRFRRQRQLRSAPLDAVLREPELPLIRLEQHLVEASHDELVARLDLAMRGATAELARRSSEGVDPAPIVGALVDGFGAIELIIDGPVPEPSLPYVATELGWQLPAVVATTAIPAGGRYAPFPCPALVHLGRVDERDLYLDLEGVGVLGVEGSRRHSRHVVHHLTATIALGAFGTRCRIVTCGIDEHATGCAVDAESHDDLDDAIDRAAGLVTPVLDVLRPGQTTARLRSASAGEPWEPTVLVAGAERVIGAAGGELVGLGSAPGRGLAVVTDAPGARCRWKLRQLDTSWLLEPLGLHVRPVGVTIPELDDLARLASVAAQPLPTAIRSERTDAPVPLPEPADREWSLMVRTFGRPRVTTRQGDEVTFTRSKALELVVWLSRHRRSGTRTGARSALWDVEVANGTFANVVSDARHSLGAAVGADETEPWLSRSVGERLELHEGITTDIDEVERALERSRREPPARARATLTDALELIAGVPFTSVPFLWPDAEGLVSQDTLLAVTVAAELAELCLAAHDLDAVFAATAVGLMVLPGHEELLALRMRAQAGRGDLASVRREWEGYERVIAGDPLGDGEPSARLVQLRNDLLGSRRR